MMTTVQGGKLFLTRVLPGRWAIQRPGTPEQDATPSWDGERFVVDRVPSFHEEEMDLVIESAAAYLLNEAGGVNPSN